MSKPSCLKDKILSERGLDSDKREASHQEASSPLVPKTGNKHTEIASNPRKPRQRGPKLLQTALQAYELSLQHFNQNEIAEALQVTPRQVRNYIRKARAYLGVPEGMKHAALVEVMLAIKQAWQQYYRCGDPRVKVLWYRAALAATVHRDRLLGLLTENILKEVTTT